MILIFKIYRRWLTQLLRGYSTKFFYSGLEAFGGYDSVVHIKGLTICVIGHTNMWYFIEAHGVMLVGGKIKARPIAHEVTCKYSSDKLVMDRNTNICKYFSVFRHEQYCSLIPRCTLIIGTSSVLFLKWFL